MAVSPGHRLWIAAMAIWAACSLSACDPLGRGGEGDRYSVSLRLDSSQYAYDLRILLVQVGTSDTLDTIFTGRAKDSSDLERLPTRRYRGGPVDAVIWAYRDGKFQWYEILRYVAPGEAPTRRKVTRKAFEPVLSLPTGTEKDTVFLAPGETVRLDTPTCVGYRKERLKVEVAGSLDSGTPGHYAIRYACEDSLGYRSEAARTFKVLSPDSLGPFLTLVGRDTLRSVLGERPRPIVIACADYKQRPLGIEKSGIVDSAHLGYYPVTYSCQDAAGRRAEAGRVFAVIPAHNRFALLRAIQETGINPALGEDNQNNGYNACLPLTRLTANGNLSLNGYLSFIQFDLARAQALNPVSARLRLRVFGTGGSPFPDSVFRCRFEVAAESLAWSEGHGNMYYYDNGFQQNGQELLKYYPMADSIMAGSRKPVGADGLLYSAGEAMMGGLESLSTDTLPLPLTHLHGLKSIPKPENLLTVEIDVTRYLRATAPEKHHGFLVAFSGLPPGQGLSFLTKEAGDGSYAPQLVIEY
jgi:hypothetical protein